jgi:hypothetical protein
MAIERDSQRMSSLKIDNIALGQGGSDYINDTAANTPGTGEIYFAVQCITDTVFAVLTDNTRGGDNPVGDTFAAGTIIYGAIEAITLTSGSVMAYVAQYKAGA